MSETNPSGAIHPTLFLVLWGVLGFGLRWIQPLEFTGPEFLGTAANTLTVTGIALFVWSAIELRRHGATLEHKDATKELVTSGPYRFSRHPIYVALTLLLLGFALDVSDWWFVILTVAFWAAVQWFTVRKEDAWLAREFGAEHARYRDSVRQWI
ncbi:MAG TPA: isoprenylcysteine carboxylmethyltransferase family protein [Longimicrobiales bacterium]|nr:isoprenylcysteine carboxylmethyltransferase family protein [Longimicrobiales bacterium]